VAEPPSLCIEVLEPQDDIERVLERCRDFVAMGVPEVWIFDPEDRKAYVWRNDGMREQSTGKLQLAGTPVEIDLGTLFAVLDE
jgi:Uma2 family endonuclease